MGNRMKNMNSSVSTIPDDTIVRSNIDSELLIKWVQEASEKKPEFKLLWKGSRDGFGAGTFHAMCDGKGPTLTIVKSTDGYIFGGYLAISWFTGGKRTHDPKAFIFSLTHKTKHSKQTNENSMQGCASYGPIFGSGDDIRISNNCNSNSGSYSNGNKTYELPSGVDGGAYFAGTNWFVVREIEVYSVFGH